MPKFSKRFIESLLPPATGQKIYRDDDTKGFCLRTTPTAKSFIVEDVCLGRRVRLTIGRVDAMTVEQARQRAQQILADMKLGILPTDRRDDPTLNEVMQAFFKERMLSPKTVETYRSIIDRALSDWKDKPITSITQAMVRERHNSLIRPTRKGSDNRNDADRAFHTLRSMMNFARSFYEINGKPLVLGHPVREALRFKWNGINARTGVIPDNKLADFYKELMRQPNKTARDYIFVLLFTSLRRNEVASLKWECIDLDNRTITLPAAFNKSKRKHTLPITDILYAIFQSRQVLRNESEFVFPGSPNSNCKTGHLCEPRAVLLRLRKVIGVEWIWHDLRRTCLSAGEKAGLPYLALKLIANHAIRRDITDRYLILDVDFLRPHLESLNDRLLGLMNTTVAQWRADDGSAGVEEPSNFGRAQNTAETVVTGDSVDVEVEEFYW